MFRLEDGWVEDVLHHLTSCHPCQQYWDSYMQRVRELDSVEARDDRDVMLEVLVGNPVHVYNLIHRLFKLWPAVSDIIQVLHGIYNSNSLISFYFRFVYPWRLVT